MSTAQALALDALVGEHVQPFYDDQAAIDAGRLAVLRHAIEGAPLPKPSLPDADRVTYSQLRIAAMFAPAVFRGFWNVQGMLRRPRDVYGDPEIVRATRDTLDRHKNDPPVPQPTQDQILAALELT